MVANFSSTAIIPKPKLSARNLSVSFQGPSFALSVSKASKPPPAASNNGSIPGKPEMRVVTSFALPVTRTATTVRALQKSMIGETKLKSYKPGIREINKNIDKLFNDYDNSNRALSDATPCAS
ncbi:hypothetical protein L1987_49624 [Smallanthus sonchifolius]|uniref:Uncharacterized protein n=1 Tax=Smallanthus sonchifolius TaxID=185202 RepID=A0ACB9FVS9_9ASTR|nr:hypothetical protein L1987_49624 [Smallanthus sonchifolius]